MNPRGCIGQMTFGMGGNLGGMSVVMDVSNYPCPSRRPIFSSRR